MAKVQEEGMTIPYNGGVVSFVAPRGCEPTYGGLGNAILDQGLKLPHKENAFLLHEVYLGPEESRRSAFARRVRAVMKNNRLLTFTRTHWRREGMYAIDDETKEDLEKAEPILDELEERLKGGDIVTESGVRKSSDGLVRFAPVSSYQFGVQTPESLSQQGDVIAVYGVEGAMKLAEVSEVFERGSRTWGEVIDLARDPVREQVTLSCLYHELLKIHGGHEFGWMNDGFAFGIEE